MSQVPSDERRYCTAVWTEIYTKLEEVIPFCWVQQANVLFPKNPTMTIAEMKEKRVQPKKDWLKYPLVKIKYRSGKHRMICYSNISGKYDNHFCVNIHLLKLGL